MAFVASMVACGGGGGDEGDGITLWDYESVTIDGSVDLSGDSFQPAGAFCRVDLTYLPSNPCICFQGPNDRVTWHNAATGKSGTGFFRIIGPRCPGGTGASCTGPPIPCEPIGINYWFSGDIPLALGENPITITVADTQRAESTTLTIRRVSP